MTNENELTLPIVIGRKYVRRDGVAVTARESHHTFSSECAYADPDNTGQRKHSHAQVLRWIAEGHGLQWLRPDGQFVPTSHEEALYVIARHGSTDEYAPERFRLAPPQPRMILVNGIEVQAGITSMPAVGEDVYYPDFSTDHERFVRRGEVGYYDDHLTELLAAGLLYLDRAACEQRAKAMAATQEAA